MSEKNESVEFVDMEHAPESHSPIGGPGELLRNARLALNMAEAEVAAALHLSTGVITALERDEFDKLPAMTFVRGYLRGYAKQVNLSPDMIIQRLNALDLPESDPPMISMPTVLARRPAKLSERLIRGSTYAIIVALILLVLMWWQSHRQEVPLANNEAGLQLQQQDDDDVLAESELLLDDELPTTDVASDDSEATSQVEKS